MGPIEIFWRAETAAEHSYRPLNAIFKRYTPAPTALRRIWLNAYTAVSASD